MPANEIQLDHKRFQRIGLDEAILCAGKSEEQIVKVLTELDNETALLTRLSQDHFLSIPSPIRSKIDYDLLSRTGIFGTLKDIQGPPKVAIVTAGTSDTPASREAARTLQYYGQKSFEITDVGVAGIWRLMERIDEIRNFSIIIVAAGMDAALPSVIGGLVPNLIIGLPTSTGYGASDLGKTAMNAMLASCAPGIAVVNIDNGYGAACVAMRAIRANK